MKARMPKPWERLPKSQREVIAGEMHMFLGNHKRLFHRQHKMVMDGTQIDYLNRRMAEIFKKGGFPQGFFDNMLGKVIVKEEGEG